MRGYHALNTLVVASGDYSSTYGGGQVYVRQVVGALRERGHSVCVFCAGIRDGAGAECRDERQDGITIREVMLGRRGLTKGQPLELCAGALAAARKALADFRPDVVHANGWKATFARACREQGVPCVITAHHGGIVCPAGALLTAQDSVCDLPVQPGRCLACCLGQMPLGRLCGAWLRFLPLRLQCAAGRLVGRLPHIPFVTGAVGLPLGIEHKRQCIEVLASYATLFVAPSKAIQEALVRNGIPLDKTVVVHHGVEPLGRQPFAPGLGSRPVRFAFVGRVNRVKGFHVLVEALTRISGEGQCELHVLGAAHTRPEQRYFRRVLSGTGGQLRVVLHGHVPRDKMAETLAVCDVMVLPSICLEVFGLVIPEAFSLGRPVIVTKCGGPEELVRDGVDGLVVERNDPQALAAALQSLIDDPARIAAMAANIGPVRTMQEHVADLERVYQMAMDKASSRRGVALAREGD